jgi:Fic family protein
LFNQEKLNKKDWRLNSPPVNAAIAHVYFESIHPFEDGNGRIGRAIAEKTLSKGFGRPICTES